MGPNRRAQDRERAAARTAAEAERKAVADAQKIVAVWNARQAGGRALWFYPTIGAAIAAGVPWLTYSCPACQQVGCIDLRTPDRHPGASISSIIPSVSCRRCSPNSPFARLENWRRNGLGGSRRQTESRKRKYNCGFSAQTCNVVKDTKNGEETHD
jgi:hypothetical protein